MTSKEKRVNNGLVEEHLEKASLELPVSADQVFKDFQKLPEEERQHVIAKIFKLRQTSPQMDILSIRNNEITKEVISPQREQTHKTIKKFQKLLSLLKTPIDTLNVDDEDFPSTYYLLKSLNPHDFFQIEGIITTGGHDQVSAEYYNTLEQIEQQFPQKRGKERKLKLPWQKETFYEGDTKDYTVMKEDLNNQQRQLIDAMDLKIAGKLVSEMSNTFINGDDIIHLSKEGNSGRNEKSSKAITKFNEKRSAIYNTGKKTVENAN